MTDAELDAIEARCRAATEGPWAWDDHGWIFPTAAFTSCVIADNAAAPEDMTFIAHARTDVPALLAEVKSLREQVAAAVRLVKRQADREASAMGDI